MKKQISLLFAVFLCCSTISWAQNPEESKMKRVLQDTQLIEAREKTSFR